MGRLHDLYEQQGQSPWLDNLRRAWLTSGELQAWIDRGVRGMTSNPTIFAKAMGETDDYDADLRRLAAGLTAPRGAPSPAEMIGVYWELVRADIAAATEVMWPVHDAADGTDGFVSVEVAPSLANDAEGTVVSARDLAEQIGAPNLMIKVPATEPGVAAIETLVGEGRSINVTLIFGLDRYRAVMEAYLAGLERCPGDLSSVASVASFFISRVDVLVDAELDKIGTDEALALKGQAAVAQAHLAYQAFREVFSGERWDALVARGARVQRPLWASTSTKDPAYPDTLYVDRLIGSDTVNTLPDATLAAFEDHGTVARTVDAEPAEAARLIARIEALGIDFGEVADRLEREGVRSFVESFDQAIATLTRRVGELG
ncbi:MAG: transaldolase [Acidimicrobiales bacterium]